ncbi:hypothetical protein HK096_009809, partial [Nowakowskiella sp. JEL0078]
MQPTQPENQTIQQQNITQLFRKLKIDIFTKCFKNQHRIDADRLEVEVKTVHKLEDLLWEIVLQKIIGKATKFENRWQLDNSVKQR